MHKTVYYRLSLLFRSILDIFGDEGSPLMRSLSSKMTLKTSDMTSLNLTSTYRASYSAERKADLNVMINTRYVTPSGRPFVHVVEECPRAYYVAFLTRIGWPLLPTFNRSIIKFFEAGEHRYFLRITHSLHLIPMYISLP